VRNRLGSYGVIFAALIGCIGIAEKAGRGEFGG